MGGRVAVKRGEGQNVWDLNGMGRSVRDIVKLMREIGAKRVRFENGFEVELADAAPPPTPVDARPEPPQPVVGCKCGHSWEEHSATGCLNGCSLDGCGPAGLEEPDDHGKRTG